MATKARRTRATWRPMNVFVAPNTRAAKRYHERAALHAPVEAAIVPGIPPTRDRDLRYRGGKIIVDLTFSNFYLGGSEAWSATDVENIDRSLAAAMSDEGLENVMVQYFPKRPTTTFKPSHVLPGPLSGSFSRGDVEKLLRKERHIKIETKTSGYCHSQLRDRCGFSWTF